MTYAVKYYYTSRHPEKGDIPFFTPKELISLAEESRYNSDNQDYDELMKQLAISNMKKDMERSMRQLSI